MRARDGEAFYLTLRATYPNPCKARDMYSDSDYCVGGTLAHYLNAPRYSNNEYFPNVKELAGLLTQANPKLPRKSAYGRADRIVSNNDCGQFEAAWGILHRALTYEPPIK